jgi:putative membrane protein
MPKFSDEQITIDFTKDISLGKAVGVILVISAIAFLFLIWLLFYNGGTNNSSEIIKNLPALNALLNGTSAILLLLGYKAVRDKKYSLHMKFNLTAVFTTILFLVSYITYHSFEGDTHFPGLGVVKYVYFSILISHIVLSALVVPLILTSLFLAFSGRIKIHRKVSKFTLPIWLYVSVTGVIIFFMLRAYTGIG